MEQDIWKYVLHNAVKHKGAADEKAILGKVLGEIPELRKDVPKAFALIQELVKKAHALTAKEQEEALKKIAPELLEQKKEEKDIFAFVEIRPGQNVVTAFPPEPSKYPHIGHAKAIFLNYEFAQRHKGKFILRFEDTNPLLAKKEFYDIHLENYQWLGIIPDFVDYASDHVEKFYRYAEQLIRKNLAYVCSCPQEMISDYRLKGMGCTCKKQNAQTNVGLWQQMLTSDAGMIVRLNLDMQHQNTTMRDPALMRIVREPHARVGTRYRVWPTYDFENSVMDGLEGVTHRFRTKEFELRGELQRSIQRMLGFPETACYEFGRFNLEGVESSGRMIREKIQKGELMGWEDPSLTTLVALRRRGFVPEAIKNFVLSTGISKAEAVLPWDDLIARNRRILDKAAKRYFFLHTMKKVRIEGAPQQMVSLRLHPDVEMGERKIEAHENFYVDDELEEGKSYRLLGCLNFKVEKGKYLFISKALDQSLHAKLIHWLPESKNLAKAEILMPDKKIIQGFAEPSVQDIDIGGIVQFVRFGFCRLDSKEEVLKFWYTHN